MNELNRDALESYYQEAASWAQDRNEDNRKSKRLAWRIAAIATALAILQCIALVLLIPLKSVVPYTLMVDRTTGYVQALKPLDQSTTTPDAALTQSFLVQYVISRESFDIATLSSNYRRVGLFSAGRARTEYLAQMAPANAANPLNLYPRTSVVQVRIKSVSPVSGDTAMVRFEKARADAGAQAPAISQWVAIIRYRYSREPMKLEDRFINPLGFQVVTYRKDPEVLPSGDQSTAVYASERLAGTPTPGVPSR